MSEEKEVMHVATYTWYANSSSGKYRDSRNTTTLVLAPFCAFVPHHLIASLAF